MPVAPKNLRGLVSEQTVQNLTRLAKSVPKSKVIVEVGSYKGKSTAALAHKTQSRVISIDPWDLPGNIDGRHHFASPDLEDTFWAQMEEAGVDKKVSHIKGFSPQVAADWNKKDKIGLLFIDGDHEEESVRADWEAWKPLLESGAIVVFDDYDTPRNPGVKAVVDSIDLEDFRVLKDNLAVGVWRP